MSAHLAFIGKREQVLIDLFPGKGRQGERRNELRPAGREDAAQLGPAFFQPPHQVEALIGGDTAGNDKEKALSRKHG